MGESEYRVLSTDYDNYAVLWNCEALDSVPKVMIPFSYTQYSSPVTKSFQYLSVNRYSNFSGRIVGSIKLSQVSECLLCKSFSPLPGLYYNMFEPTVSWFRMPFLWPVFPVTHKSGKSYGVCVCVGVIFMLRLLHLEFP